MWSSPRQATPPRGATPRGATLRGAARVERRRALGFKRVHERLVARIGKHFFEIIVTTFVLGACFFKGEGSEVKLLDPFPLVGRLR